MKPEERKEKLLKLAVEMCAGELPINPECAEYQLLDYLLNDDELALMSEMKLVGPSTAKQLAKKAGMPYEKAKRVLEGCAEKAYFMDVKLGKNGAKIYILVPFAPGIFEFQMAREGGFADDNPEISYLFHRHAFESYSEYGPNSPMGVGIMRVVPVESALPAGSKILTMERLSTLIETTVGGAFCRVPCQCRKVRRIMGEATGDLEDGMCIYMGLLAETMLRHGRGERLTKEQVYEHLERTEALGCVHQITTLESGISFAICNCQPQSCMAIGGAAYFGAPNMVRSNYVSEIDSSKCVACGQCVEVCGNHALKLGQKICSKTPIVHKQVELPDEQEWGPERFDPDHRERVLVTETGTAPCKTTCPAHIAIQGYIRLAAQGKYMEALELIKKENPLPAVCGRICPHNCENECTRGELDQAVAIDEVKRFIADREIEETQRFVPRKLWDHDKKIAVIGSGPAGISCAYYLAAGGFKVTVFEKENKPGGMLVNGIPAFRLEKDVVEAEIDVLRELGVEFRCGVEVGTDVTIPQLRAQGFEAFYLGIGLQNCGTLGISGDDAEGVIAGVEFLKDINRGNEVELSGNVVVIGGGSIGADVARTAKRYGAKKVDLYCLESYDEMPMGEEDQAYCKEDGITIHDGWGQTEILTTKDGRCKGIKFRKCTSVKNDEGRFDPKFDDSITEEAKCSTVLFCIGQRPDWGKLLTGVNVELTERGFVKADPLTYQTSEPDIFAGGDIYTGQKFCIDAIAAGKEASISINRFVWPGHSLTIGRDVRNYHALDKSDLDWNRISWDNIKRQIPKVDASKVGTKRNESLTFTEEQLKAETARCLGCGATIVDQNRCIGCGLCTTRCKFDAIHLIKKFDEPVHSIRFRKKFVENYQKDRAMKIAVKKFIKEDNSRGDASKR